MKKESVKKFDLEAAFKALDEIDIPVAEKGIKANRVDLKERFAHKPAHESLVEDYYDVTSNEDLEEAQDEREGEVAQAKLARIEKIVDLDAESPDDLLPSYVGKVIMQCPQCMTLFYKNPEDIEHSEENPDVVNINEICQHCGNSSGYTLIGKVDSVSADEADNYSAEESELPAEEEENELDLDFEEPTEEVDAEGTGEGAEELSDDEMAELELELEEIPEEEKKEESLNLSKELKDAEEGSELATEHKSENLTLNEDTTDESLNNSEAQKDAEEGSDLKTENESENLTLNEAKYDAELTVHDTWKVNDIEAADEEEAEEIAQEKIDNGEEDDYSEYDDGIQVTKIAEGLNEEVDKDLDKKLKAHNDYIAYLQQMIKQEEEALKNAENDEIKAAIQRRLDAFNADLEAALPDAVKEAPVEEIAEEPVVEEEPTEVQAEEEPKEEPAEEEAPVEEALTEDGAEEEKPAEEPKEEGNEVDYVEYKHSYCHVLSPKLRALNYLVNVRKAEPGLVKGYIKKLLKDPEVKWTSKEKEFLKNIEEKDDARDIYNYVKNSIEKAKTIKVKVDENGELIESLNEGFEGCVYEALNESLNNSEAQKDAEEHSELKTENESENLTLNEDVNDAEIEAIINSWNFDDVNEALDQDKEEQDTTDAEVQATIDSWADQLAECGERPIEECDKAVLKEDDEEPEEEKSEDDKDDDDNDGSSGEGGAAEEAAEELPNVDFNTEEVKEVAQEAAEEVIKEAEAEVEPEVVEEKVEEVVAEKVEEKIEASEEAPIEEPEIIEDEVVEEEPVEEALTEDADAGLDKLLDSEEFQKPISDAEVEEYFDESKDENLEEGVWDKIKGAAKAVKDKGIKGAIKGAFENNELDNGFNGFKVLIWTQGDDSKFSILDDGKANRTQAFDKFVDADNYAKKWADLPRNEHDSVIIYGITDKAHLSKADYAALESRDDEIPGLVFIKRWVHDSGIKKAKCDKDDTEVVARELKNDRKDKESGEDESPKGAHLDEVTDAKVDSLTKKDYTIDILGAVLPGDIDNYAEARIVAQDKSKDAKGVIVKVKATALDGTKIVLTGFVNGEPNKNNLARLNALVKGDLSHLRESIDISVAEDLNEELFNKHVTDYLTTVYSNVNVFEATGCSIEDNKLLIEGVVKFNSGKEKAVMFEFLPSYDDGHLFFEGINKKLAADGKFLLCCSLDETNKTLLTESIYYNYNIEDKLVEGLN